MEAKQTPLIELLERIPQDARLVVEHDQFSSSVHPVGRLCHEAAAALRAALAEPEPPPEAQTEAEKMVHCAGWWDALEKARKAKPVQCEPQYANEDGWCEWVCPAPKGYLMQCCDCGLIHEVESRVAKYEPRPSEAFEVVDDPDLQAQWRMKRRDDISPKQAPQRPAEPVQEPVAWRFEARHIDSAWAAAVTLKHPGAEGVYMRNVVPLYTAPPQRKPLTEEEALDIARTFGAQPWPPGSCVAFARAIERAHGITS